MQRSLKIIGIFSRLFIRDKKKQYLKFIPYTWKLLEMRMNSEIFSELKKILDTVISLENLEKKLYINEGTSSISQKFLTIHSLMKVEFSETLKSGDFVRVPFGSSEITGVVWPHEQKTEKKI